MNTDANNYTENTSKHKHDIRMLINTYIQVCTNVCVLIVILNCWNLDMIFSGTQFFHLHDVGQTEEKNIL